MKLQVRMGADGSLELRALDGTFESASPELQALLDQFRARGINIVDQSLPEQHSHAPGERVHSHARA